MNRPAQLRDEVAYDVPSSLGVSVGDDDHLSANTDNLQPVVEQDEAYEAVRHGNTDWLTDAAITVAFTNDTDYLRKQIERHTGLRIEVAA